MKGEKISHPGQDYRELQEILKKYPKSYVIAWNREQKRGKSSQRLRLLEAFRSFERELDTWISMVRQKITLGVYGPEKQIFYLKLIQQFDTYLSNQTLVKKLIFAHHIVATTKLPLFDGLSFDQRFLKPRYAKAYQGRKISFYKDQLRVLDKADLPKEEKEKRRAILLAKLEKWQSKTIQKDVKNPRIFPMDGLMGIPTMHAMGFKGRGVSIAVVEPVSTQATELRASYDLSSSLESASPLSRHGAHVSGIILAKAKTTVHRQGVAPKARLFYFGLPIEGLESRLTYTQQTPRKAIDSALTPAGDEALAQTIGAIEQKGIKIINLSMVVALGPKSYKAFKSFMERGGVIVKAAGNSGTPLDIAYEENPKLPKQKYLQLVKDISFFKALAKDHAFQNHTLVVGNLTEGQKLDATSNKPGRFQDRFLVAWGQEVPAPTQGYSWERMSGTSMAAPMVTGAMGLMKEAFPHCAMDILGQVLLDGAAFAGPGDIMGQGRLDLTESHALAQKVCPKSNG